MLRSVFLRPVDRPYMDRIIRPGIPLQWLIIIKLVIHYKHGTRMIHFTGKKQLPIVIVIYHPPGSSHKSESYRLQLDSEGHLTVMALEKQFKLELVSECDEDGKYSVIIAYNHQTGYSLRTYDNGNVVHITGENGNFHSTFIVI
ncbi:unnamed protein product [Didymodactylos carnosus]|uniref:Uncharacterized protein n=1 Tax=Didymodactylos carnosus TaxID=1234261 RepID=A0A814S162_9BILA|nr:unnamed protein product [Didymodactylos carnosus]CAF3903847.1 unnamed protein product [Didymodactylos carnosus]